MASDQGMKKPPLAANRQQRVCPLATGHLMALLILTGGLLGPDLTRLSTMRPVVADRPRGWRAQGGQRGQFGGNRKWSPGTPHYHTGITREI